MDDFFSQLGPSKKPNSDPRNLFDNLENCLNVFEQLNQVFEKNVNKHERKINFLKEITQVASTDGAQFFLETSGWDVDVSTKT